MRVLVACEMSGRVRDAFLARGHYAEFKATITFRYEVTDDLKLREKFYGTADLQACAEIDTRNGADLLIPLASDDPILTVEVVK